MVYDFSDLKCLFRLQLARQAENSVGEMAYFDHYYVQVEDVRFFIILTPPFLEFSDSVHDDWRVSMFPRILFPQICRV